MLQTLFHSHHIEVAEKGLLCKHPLSNDFWSTVSEMPNNWVFCLCIVRESSLVLLSEKQICNPVCNEPKPAHSGETLFISYLREDGC